MSLIKCYVVEIASKDFQKLFFLDNLFLYDTKMTLLNHTPSVKVRKCITLKRRYQL